MTLTPHRRELAEIIVDVIRENSYLLIERPLAKMRFEYVNGITRDEPCQK
jgi:hypothetical protein